MSVTPTKAAIRLTKVWRATCEESEWFPVGCRKITTILGIKVRGESMGKEFQGGLFLEDGLKAILYNEDISEEGRKNFTIAHELGHYSVHKDKKDLQCSMADLNDFSSGPHPAGIEQEANSFSAMLLMPPNDFRRQTKGRQLTLSLLGELADHRYQTTLMATTIQLIDLTSEPVAVVCIRAPDNRIEWARRSSSMKQTGCWLENGRKLPSAAITGNRNGHFVNSDVWLDERYADRWVIFQSIIHMPSYKQTLVVLHASSEEGAADLWDDV